MFSSFRSVRYFWPLFLCPAFMSGIIGCGDGGVQPIQVNIANDPLDQPRTHLKRYAAGASIGSEATSFEFMINEVKKADPVRGETLEKGFAALQKADPSEVPAMATELLGKIQSAGIPTQ